MLNAFQARFPISSELTEYSAEHYCHRKQLLSQRISKRSAEREKKRHLAERDELRGLRRRAVLDLDPAVLADAPLPPVRDVQHLRHEAPVLDGDLGRENDRGDA